MLYTVMKDGKPIIENVSHEAADEVYRNTNAPVSIVLTSSFPCFAV